MEVKDIFSDLPPLETERLVLRRLTIDDLEDMFHYGSNDEVTKYVTWDTHQTKADSKAFIEFVLNRYENGQVAPWGIEHKDNGKLIGTVDYVSWQPGNHTAEIGYVISRDYWGQGIATEAVKRIIAFGFEKMALVRIQARCFPENTGSERVMQKAGMSYEGTMRKSLFIKGKHWDGKMYSILREEY
ncbi:GNAT family N-acetyltransferase [Jeotgalibacillus terrae]|uniref:GNAT family N-acetyltransferase n=1 Tax=Jeotgalibacillus terrae TaxID=587735 RepID=A0ABW5ZLR0_9BACL|nr:GNAT family protein [Jeotgalibacillus terrae]MBM7578064.1 ribosomal-protein-alanine N-acetyltransferase [Jeotgalibacillus terrae]